VAFRDDAVGALTPFLRARVVLENDGHAHVTVGKMRQGPVYESGERLRSWTRIYNIADVDGGPSDGGSVVTYAVPSAGEKSSLNDYVTTLVEKKKFSTSVRLTLSDEMGFGS